MASDWTVWGNFRFPDQLNSSKNRFAFTGYIWDKETSLFFAKARFYDPEIGRFISQDSFLGNVDTPPSLHRYLYANNNPTRFIDLTGRAGQEANSRAAAFLAEGLMRLRQAGEDTGLFLTGAANAFGSNFLLGAGRTDLDNRVFKRGQFIGDVLSVAAGAAETIIGGGLVVGGSAEAVAASPTVAGSVPGVATAAAGFVLAGQGASAVSLAQQNLSKALNDSSSGGGDGAGSKGEPKVVKENTPSGSNLSSSKQTPAKGTEAPKPPDEVPRIIKNKQQGDTGEATILERLRRNPNVEILGEQPQVRLEGTPKRRRLDILIEKKATGERINVEVKTGGARRTPVQRAKDADLAVGKGTTFTGRVVRESPRLNQGEPTGPTRTVEARPKVKKPDEP